MTFVEFIHPLRWSSQRNLVLAAMYYLKGHEGREAVTASEIKNALSSAKVPKSNAMSVHRVLNQASPYVHSPGRRESGALLFALTDTGDKYVRELLQVRSTETEVEHDVITLSELLPKIADEDVRGYVEEAITCLRFGALRASVVFLWTGAIRTLHLAALATGETTVNGALQKLDGKAWTIRTVDDFAWIKDRTFLNATPDIGILDKTQKGTLVAALNLRNSCGHPTKYRPREKRVSAFIEDVVGIVFTQTVA